MWLIPFYSWASRFSITFWTNWYIVKWNSLIISFVIQHIKNVSRIFTTFQISLYIYHLKWRVKWTKSWVRSICFECFLFETQNYFYVFASNFIFFKFFTQVVKYHNIILTLSNVVQINFEIDNVDLTLFNVVNLNFDVRKVASTLIWRSPALRRLINRTATLQQWWNVCWGKISYK